MGSPDQPRDSRGRWGSGGNDAGGNGGGKETLTSGGGGGGGGSNPFTKGQGQAGTRTARQQRTVDARAARSSIRITAAMIRSGHR